MKPVTELEIDLVGQDPNLEPANEQVAPHKNYDEEEDATPWLASFADMVTLLMCFFILFFSVSKDSPVVSESEHLMSKKLRVLLGYTEPVPDGGESDIENDQQASGGGPAGEESDNLASSTGDDSKENSTNESGDGEKESIDVAFALGYQNPDVIEMVLLTAKLFKSGRADLTAEGKKIIQGIAREVHAIAKDALIDVEGHTDSDPVKPGNIIKSNWTLSSARAAAVAEEMVAQGILGKKIKISGYANQRPLVPEYDDKGFPIYSNKALNRRISIKLHMASKDSGAESKPVAH